MTCKPIFLKHLFRNSTCFNNGPTKNLRKRVSFPYVIYPKSSWFAPLVVVTWEDSECKNALDLFKKSAAPSSRTLILAPLSSNPLMGTPFPINFIKSSISEIQILRVSENIYGCVFVGIHILALSTPLNIHLR